MMPGEKNPFQYFKAFTLVLVVAVSLVFCAIAAESSGFDYWSASDLQGYSKKLAVRMNAQKVASERLVDYGNHFLMVAHREGSGEAELHERQSDIFIVQSGQATLLVGGRIVGGKTTAPNEIRGPSIEGGEKRKLSTGDIVHITNKVPHQLLLEPGKEFTYAVVKVDTAN
ncbi:MAG TPA: cupin domain-containing protein [Acidobacteriota bacterium]